ncbi:hypothetical protein MJ1_0110 [Nanobdella aerobiophila]|uniref:Uncharacterized protein n=1 Tax=Nanobdella aerobiophila TaxID=2586965 RepID=A0A915SEV8_9ARCH|nr:hypothetical protein [Nanobdella aerobiophila]BBL45285.1 hypothetical protein MJ1_0110 [Nanobdella aerobiophila]
MEKWFWLIATVIGFGISMYLYLKFSYMNNEIYLVSNQINQCQNLFNSIEEVCNANNGTSITTNFQISKYLNYISSNGNEVTCYIYNQYIKYNSSCNIIIEGTISYNNTLYKYANLNNNVENIEITIYKNNPNSIEIYSST